MVPFVNVFHFVHIVIKRMRRRSGFVRFKELGSTSQLDERYSIKYKYTF